MGIIRKKETKIQIRDEGPIPMMTQKSVRTKYIYNKCICVYLPIVHIYILNPKCIKIKQRAARGFLY